MKERGRPRLDFSDPSRVQQMRVMMLDEPRPRLSWSDIAITAAVWLAMVAAAVFVALTLLDLW